MKRKTQGNDQRVTAGLAVAVVVAGMLAAAWVWRQAVITQWQEANNLRQKQLRQEAVAACGEIAQVTWVDKKKDGSGVTEPYRPAFEQCVRDMGYEE